MSFNIRKLKEEKPSRLPKVSKILITVFAIYKPLIGWYRLWEIRHEEEKRRKKNVNILKRTLFILISVLVSLIIVVITVKALMSLEILNLGTITSVAGAQLPKDENGYTNILLIGQGNDNHDGKDLTDTIIVASLDPTKTKSALLLSIPRDVFFLGTEKMGKGRINSLYRDYKHYLEINKDMKSEDASLEAIRELKDEIGRKLGMTIHHAIKVNFTAFTEMVDAINGVDILVPEEIVDTEYPDNQYGYETFTMEKGMQHLDGETALKYARSRHSTSDFSRSARQQQLVTAIGKKVKEEGMLSDPAFITSMFQNLSANMSSTMTIRELIGLADMGQNIEKDNVISVQFNDRNALYDGFVEPGGFLYTPPRDLFGGAAVLLPISIPEFPVTWKRPQTFISLMQNARKIYIQNPKIAILNNGAKSGTARILATELIRYGFTINEIENAQLPEKQDSSIIFAQNEYGNAMATFFSDLLQIKISEPPSLLPVDQIQEITIILGKDFTYQPLQNILSNTK